jgi:predicted nucleotidyltransferase
MTPSRAKPFSIAQEIATQFAQIDSVEAVTLGGSLATGKANASSDIDLYIYSNESIPVELRANIIEGRSSQMQLNNTFWETEDYWIEKESSIKVEAIYRGEWPVEALKDIFNNNRAHMGFSTSIWHNITTSKILFDRIGWYAALQKIAAVSYPQSLAKAIIHKNFALLKGSLAEHPTQLALAAKRNDVIHVHHRIDMILSSYFDILFALNRTLHPGDKRMLSYAQELTYTPKGMLEDVTNLVTNQDNAIAKVKQLIDRLEALLIEHRAI